MMLLVLLAVAQLMLSTGETSHDQVLKALQSGNWEVRFGAVTKVSANLVYLDNSVLQTRLIHILNRESLDPNWAGKEEYSAYEQYYDTLGNLVKVIADRSQRSDAWKALLQSNFDELSKFAIDLEESPKSLPYLIEATKSPYQTVQGRSAYMLADELSRCKGTEVKGNCGDVLKNSTTILNILRGAISQSQGPAQRLGAIRGLGLCGETRDIPLLKQLGRSNPDRWLNLFIDRACQRIQAREQEKDSHLGKEQDKPGTAH